MKKIAVIKTITLVKRKIKICGIINLELCKQALQHSDSLKRFIH